MPSQLETERLILRPFTEDDLDAAYEMLEGHPDVWKYDPGFQRTREVRDAIIRKYIMTNDPDGVGTLAVVRKDTGALIGYVGLQFYILPREPLATPEVELYYKLGRQHWDQGFAIEACQRMLDWAFDDLRLHRIVTITDKNNEPSKRLMERLGMRIEPAPPEWPDDLTGTLENNRH